MIGKMIHEEIIRQLINTRQKFTDITSFSKKPGIYAMFLCGDNIILKDTDIKPTDIIYLGKTESSQESRDVNTHFKSGETGSSTIRKSLGSLLRNDFELKPIIRSEKDILRRRFSHFKFDDESEIILTDWLVNNLALSFFEFSGNKRELKKLEKELILKTTPLLNITYNHRNPVLRMLKQSRGESAQLAFIRFNKLRNDPQLSYTEVPKMTNSSKNKYVLLWQGYINQILEKLIISDKPQKMQLDRTKFSQVGNRNSYSFNLEYKNGEVSNNIGGSAVARDLDKVISQSNHIRNTLKEGSYKINLDKEFVLHIQRTI